jgi:regulatory protein
MAGRLLARRSVAERRERRAAVADPGVVLEAAAAFLAVRPRSIAETRARLASMGYRAPLVDLVVERLRGYGYLDDVAFGRAWLESRDRVRPRGRIVLCRELLAKGLAPALVATLLDERPGVGQDATNGDADAVADGDADPARHDPDVTAAQRLLARRRAALARQADPRRRRHRAYALLARNGFDPEVIRQALGTPLTDDTTPDQEEPGEAL